MRGREREGEGERKGGGRSYVERLLLALYYQPCTRACACTNTVHWRKIPGRMNSTKVQNPWRKMQVVLTPLESSVFMSNSKEMWWP